MFNVVTQWFTSWLIGLAFAALQYAIGSIYLSDYLLKNIISIQLTVVAINLATLGIVATKLADLIEKGYNPISFEKSISEMKLSLYEQAGLIFFASIVGILSNVQCNKYLYVMGNGVMIGLLVQHVRILLDSGNSVFIALVESAKLKNKNSI